MGMSPGKTTKIHFTGDIQAILFYPEIRPNVLLLSVFHAYLSLRHLSEVYRSSCWQFLCAFVLQVMVIFMVMFS